MNRSEINRLIDEKNYEEEIAERITNFLLKDLPSIHEISNEQKETIEKNLKIIKKDSIIHKKLFDKIITIVENEQV